MIVKTTVDCNSVVILVNAPGETFWSAVLHQSVILHVSSPSDPDNNTSCCKIMAFSTHLFHHGTNYLNVLSVLPCGVRFHHKHRITLNNVAYTMSLRIITLGKPTRGLKGQNAQKVFMCGHFWLKKLGWWVVGRKEPKKDHILEQLCVLHNFNQTTQNMACWERAYPHCSLGKCQLVLRTSKQSLLHLLYSLRAPTVL